MKKVRQYLSLWAIGAAAVITAATLTAATYAWFSANREVETEKVTARTGSVSLALQISREGGDQFSSKTETDTDGEIYTSGTIYSVVSLKERENVLMPVSTGDLQTFVYSPMTDDGQATEGTLRVLHGDVEAENQLAETLYYHDTLYLRLTGDDSIPADTQANLYLDKLDKLPIVEAPEGSQLLAASRLGLIIDGGTPLILRFAEDGENALSNTVLDGEQLAAGLVLIEKDGSIIPSEKDPSHLLEDYQYSGSDAQPASLVTMKLGQIYQLDIFFYLEGCDPDCLTEQVGWDSASLALAFYAALV